jgi:caffeoyl-CoA O-methyltransferase
LLPERAGMQVSAGQAALLRLLTGLMGARQAVEIGTFTGLSALSVACGVANGGRLTCFDISEEFTDVACWHWRRAGVDDRI